MLIATLTGGGASAAEANHATTAAAPLSRAANTDPRTIEFVHGINGNYRNFQCSNLTGGFAAIVTYFVQPIRFGAAGKEDTAATYTANLMLVWEQSTRWERGAWHFAGTTQPSS